MRTINAALKTACQTGAGSLITSATIVAIDALPDQTYTVLDYAKHGDQLTATLYGTEFPNYGKLIISRGYAVGGVDYLEPLPKFIIRSVKQTKPTVGIYEVSGNIFSDQKMFVEAGGVYFEALYIYLTGRGSSGNVVITTPEQGSANSIFDRIVTVDKNQFNNAKQAIYAVGPWPCVRFYQTETGVQAVANLSDVVNVASVSVLYSLRLRNYDWVVENYVWIGTPVSIVPYLDETIRASSGIDQVIYYDGFQFSPAPYVPQATAKYYNESVNAHSMFLLPDVSLEEGDRFSYDGYDWRIESITEILATNKFEMSLYCLQIGATPVPYYILLETGDFLLLETGDKVLME